jgi:GcrA cell cycle regulator
MNVHVQTRTRIAWSEADYDLLARLWGEGFSASEIAKQMPGRTRNSIVGCVTRLGLPQRQTRYAAIPIYTARQPKEKKPKPIAEPIKQIAKSKIWHPLDNSTPVTLIDKQRHQCSWPVGEGLFCGETKLNERPYCPIHCRVAYEPRKRRA